MLSDLSLPSGQYMLILYNRGWGVGERGLSTFCPRGQRGGYIKCPRLSTRGGRRSKLGKVWSMKLLNDLCKNGNSFLLLLHQGHLPWLNAPVGKGIWGIVHTKFWYTDTKGLKIRYTLMFYPNAWSVFICGAICFCIFLVKSFCIYKLSSYQNPNVLWLVHTLNSYPVD